LNANAVVTSYLRKSDNEPTSIILVSKSTSTPDFIAYREADCQIDQSQIPELLELNFSYHLFCIEQKIRREPLSWRVLKKKSFRLQTSIDINFSERIWPDREEAKRC
jgi:fructokinase